MRACADCNKKNASWGMPQDRKRKWCATCGRDHEGAVDLEEIDDAVQRRSIEQQIYEFGQTPKQQDKQLSFCPVLSDP